MTDSKMTIGRKRKNYEDKLIFLGVSYNYSSFDCSENNRR